MTSEFNRPFSEVLTDVVGNVQEIIRSEFRLAKAEMKVEGSKAAKGATVLVAGALLGLYAGGFLLLAAVYALSQVMTLWQSAFLVALITGIAAAILITAGRRKIKTVHPAPERTIENVKENIEWAEKH